MFHMRGKAKVTQRKGGDPGTISLEGKRRDSC